MVLDRSITLNNIQHFGNSWYGVVGQKFSSYARRQTTNKLPGQNGRFGFFGECRVSHFKQLFQLSFVSGRVFACTEYSGCNST